MDGKTALGASSPANPALHIPDPLSTTRAAISSSALKAMVLMESFFIIDINMIVLSEIRNVQL